MKSENQHDPVLFSENYLTHPIDCDCSHCSDFEKQLTAETFIDVVNKVATREELRAVEIVDTVVKNKNADLILKSIINRMLSQDWEGTQEVINAAVFHHIDTLEGTTLLDIIWAE